MRQSVLAMATVIALAACGPSMSDAQRNWCRGFGGPQHDMTTLTPYGGDDAVLKSAQSLGIKVPQPVAEANLMIRIINAGGDWGGVSMPDWEDDLDEWRATSDYARACIAAFDAR